MFVAGRPTLGFTLCVVDRLGPVVSAASEEFAFRPFSGRKRRAFLQNAAGIRNIVLGATTSLTGGSLMDQSSCFFEVSGERRSGLEHRPDDVHASARQAP
jgi:hypothetical protein